MNTVKLYQNGEPAQAEVELPIPFVVADQECGQQPFEQQSMADEQYKLNEEYVGADEQRAGSHVAEVIEEVLAHNNGQFGARPTADQEALDQEHKAEVRVDHRGLHDHPEVEEGDQDGRREEEQEKHIYGPTSGQKKARIHCFFFSIEQSLKISRYFIPTN